MIAYILLGGYPPFYSDDETELFRVIQSGVFEFHSPFWDHVSDLAQVGNYVVSPSSQHAHGRDLHHLNPPPPPHPPHPPPPPPTLPPRIKE